MWLQFEKRAHLQIWGWRPLWGWLLPFGGALLEDVHTMPMVA